MLLQLLGTPWTRGPLAKRAYAPDGAVVAPPLASPADEQLKSPGKDPQPTGWGSSRCSNFGSFGRV